MRFRLGSHWHIYNILPISRSVPCLNVHLLNIHWSYIFTALKLGLQRQDISSLQLFKIISAKIISSSFQYHTHKKCIPQLILWRRCSWRDVLRHWPLYPPCNSWGHPGWTGPVSQWELLCHLYKEIQENTHSKLSTKYHTTFASQISLNLPHPSPRFTKAKLMLTCSVYKVYLCESCWTDKTRFEIR